ncbi:acyltransferase [Acidaminobacter sp. JC074]|uniref:acyltransferase family protein n=1 Tax=Acidaminobacter sp. JC074 TaxID=2530199 RepID=UPI001F10DBBB|nr:acyltransferase [Acidaminobacter sp. JC074]
MKGNIRLDYLDNLKVLLTILVIVHHIAIAFGGEGAFVIASQTQGSGLFNLGMTGFLAINQSYFMGLFFAISSFFSYKSLKKKGRQGFIHAKFKRLFIPALIYYIGLSPLNNIIVQVFQKGMDDGLSLSFSIGALWFVLALFLFDCVYAFTNQLLEKIKIKHMIYLLPLTVILTWLVRMITPVGVFLPVVAFQPAHFIQYIYAYALGVIVSRDNILDEIMSIKYYKVLILLIPILGLLGLVIYGLITSVGDITYAFGGGNIYSLLYSLFDMLMFCTMSLGLTSVFQHFFNREYTIVKWMSKYAFGAYVMHYMGVTITILFLNQLAIGHGLTFVLTVIIGIPLSFILGKVFKPIFG